MNNQSWFPLELIDLISLLPKGLSRVFSSTTVWKHQFLGIHPSLWSNCHICTWLLEKPQLWLYGPHSTSLTWHLEVLCQKFWGSSRLLVYEPSYHLAWPCKEHFSASKSTVSVCLASLYFRHTNLHQQFGSAAWKLSEIFLCLKKFLFIWLCWVVAACGIFVVSCGAFCYRVWTL